MKSTKDIQINAPAIKVWKTLTEINEWPKWQAGVKKCISTGKLEKGGVFTWVSGGMSIGSEIVSVEAPHLIAWQGKTIGTKAFHSYNNKCITSEITQVETSEEMRGWLVSIIGIIDSSFLEKALNEALNELKTECEKIG